MKKILLLSSVLLFAYFAIGQTVLFSDDFESYNTGESVAAQTSSWTTWSGATTSGEAALVSEAQAHGGIKSLNVIPNNDMIYNFGNKTSGVYQIEFYYYVATGSQAYFNIEHIFADEWAFSCEFAAGTMTLNNDAATPPTFAYTQDSWLYFDILVDIGNDLITLDLDGTELASWTFSTLEGGGAAANQLGCINFYGPANNNYFIDDFVYTEIESGLTPPTIDLTATPITTATGDDETISFDNTGEEELSFVAYPIFDDNFSAKNGTKDGIMHVDGDNAGNAVGWASEITAYIATRFSPEVVRPFMGQEITSVDIYIGDAPAGDITVYVWDKGGFITPGTTNILDQVTITPTEASWNTITLNTPILLTGDEIWVGYYLTAPLDSYCVGIDENATIAGANYIKAGPVWSEFGGIAGTGNWNIRANVTGTSWPIWMSVAPATGTVAAAGSQNLTLSFDNTDLENGDYTGTLAIGCNDQEAEWNEIDVTYTVFVGVDDVKQTLATYPNPTTGIFNIETSSVIENVEIYNTAGQLVNLINVNNSKCVVDLSNNTGVYIVKINTIDGQIIRRVICE
ncbi:MAG: T9SS type A sorting domain-containing protein [Bacteroidales bacterium]|nr:T9SS type A sorting domain-containing protein [Bacteroidales bacterium]